MAEILYSVSSFGGERFMAPESFQEARKRLRERASAHPNPWRVKRAGQADFGPVENLVPALERIERMAKRRRPDADMDTFVLHHVNRDKNFFIKEVERHPHAAFPYSNRDRIHPKLVHAYETIFGAEEFRGKVDFGGAENCRMARQGGFWSMHSYWPPVLAMDFFCDHETQLRLERVLNEHIDGLIVVTFQDNSLHDTHAHVQVGDNRYGQTPACAG